LLGFDPGVMLVRKLRLRLWFNRIRIDWREDKSLFLIGNSLALLIILGIYLFFIISLIFVCTGKEYFHHEFMFILMIFYMSYMTHFQMMVIGVFKFTGNNEEHFPADRFLLLSRIDLEQLGTSQIRSRGIIIFLQSVAFIFFLVPFYRYDDLSFSAMMAYWISWVLVNCSIFITAVGGEISSAKNFSTMSTLRRIWRGGSIQGKLRGFRPFVSGFGHFFLVLIPFVVFRDNDWIALGLLITTLFFGLIAYICWVKGIHDSLGTYEAWRSRVVGSEPNQSFSNEDWDGRFPWEIGILDKRRYRLDEEFAGIDAIQDYQEVSHKHMMISGYGFGGLVALVWFGGFFLVGLFDSILSRSPFDFELFSMFIVGGLVFILPFFTLYAIIWSSDLHPLSIIKFDRVHSNKSVAFDWIYLMPYGKDDVVDLANRVHLRTWYKMIPLFLWVILIAYLGMRFEFIIGFLVICVLFMIPSPFSRELRKIYEK